MNPRFVNLHRRFYKSVAVGIPCGAHESVFLLLNFLAIIFMCVSVGLHICLHTMCIGGALGGQKLELMGVGKPPCGFWEINLGSLQEQKSL